MCGKENIWESAHFLPTILSAPKGEFFIYLDYSSELPPTVLLDMRNNKVCRDRGHKTAVNAARAAAATPSPFLRTQRGEGCSQKAKISPQNCHTCLDLTAGTAGGFSCCFQESSHPTSPMVQPSQTYFCLNFQGDSSYLMRSIFIARKSVWKIPGLEWCRKLWQNIWTRFSSLDISVLPET